MAVIVALCLDGNIPKYGVTEMLYLWYRILTVMKTDYMRGFAGRHLGRSIRKLLMLCKVARLGFASGIDVDIQPKRLLMKSLFGEVFMSFAILPSSSKKRHKIASATPMDRSFPLSQPMTICFAFRGSSVPIESPVLIKLRMKGKAMRRFRLPTL